VSKTSRSLGTVFRILGIHNLLASGFRICISESRIRIRHFESRIRIPSLLGTAHLLLFDNIFLLVVGTKSRVQNRRTVPGFHPGNENHTVPTVTYSCLKRLVCWQAYRSATTGRTASRSCSPGWRSTPSSSGTGRTLPGRRRGSGSSDSSS